MERNRKPSKKAGRSAPEQQQQDSQPSPRRPPRAEQPAARQPQQEPRQAHSKDAAQLGASAAKTATTATRSQQQQQQQQQQPEPDNPPAAKAPKRRGPPPHRESWWAAFVEEVRALDGVLHGRGRAAAYRHHLWMRRGLWLHRMLKREMTAAEAAIADVEGTVESDTHADRVRLWLVAVPATSLGENSAAASLPTVTTPTVTVHSKMLRAAALAGAEATNELRLERTDTAGVCLCLLASAARLHALLSFADPSDTAAYGWAMPPGIAAQLGVPVTTITDAEAAARQQGRALQPSKVQRRKGGRADADAEDEAGRVDPAEPRAADDNAGDEAQAVSRQQTLGQLLASYL